MRRFHSSLVSVLLATSLLASPPPAAPGAILIDGDVDPDSPSSWVSGSRTGYVGRTAYGAVEVSGGSGASTSAGYIGQDSGSTGVVTVAGADSTWTMSNPHSDGLFVGHSGSGTLRILDGGTVSIDSSTHVAYLPGSTGLIDFGSDGGTLITRTLYASPSQLTGKGTIIARGLVGDVDLVFDSTVGASQTFTLSGQPGTGVTMSLDVSGASGSFGDLGAGYRGEGSLEIREGVAASSEFGYIGYGANATGEVTVDGGGSTWTIGGDDRSSLYVGYFGKGTLDVSGGAVVTNVWHGYVGCESGSTGTVNVDGKDSKWISDRDLYIGYLGNGELNVSGGGAVRGRHFGYIGCDSVSTGKVTVDGEDSEWRTSENLFVGHSGEGTLDISGGGGAVSLDSSFIGYQAGSTGTVTVDGERSEWRISRDLFVGYFGAGTLDIRGGGTVIGDDSASDRYSSYVGHDSGVTGEVTVDGPTSQWINGNDLYLGYCGTGILHLTNHATVSVAGDTFLAYEAGSTGLVDFGPEGGTLSTRTLYASSAHFGGMGTVETRGLVGDVDWVFDPAQGSNQTLTLSSHAEQDVTIRLDASGESGPRGNLGAGYQGTGSLSIPDGIEVASMYGYIGHSAGSTGEVTLDGADSAWTIDYGLYVGRHGSGTLAVTGGAALGSRSGFIGLVSGSTGEVTIGSGSTWMNAERLTVGSYGNGTLHIAGDSVVDCSFADVAVGADSIGAVTVDGADSEWTTRSLFVGFGGTGTLDVTNGAKVSDESCGDIGHEAGSTGVVTVDGVGSEWTGDTDLYVGYGGSGTLRITNGAAVSAENATYVAYEVGSTGLVDFGSNGGTLSTGTLYASPQQMTGTGSIDVGGLVSDVELVFDSTHGLIQTLTVESQSGQEITIDLDMTDSSGGTPTPPWPPFPPFPPGEVGSVCDLGAGYLGIGSVTIRDGKEVDTGSGYIGYHPGSAGEITVEGGNSTWTISHNLFVGRQGSGTLHVIGGAAVSNSLGCIGEEIGSAGTVTVEGEDSEWTNNGYLYVGYRGGGTLEVRGGAAVRNESFAWIGYKSFSANLVTVDGEGSRWTSDGELYVGDSGNGTLRITDRATVSNDSRSYIGHRSASTGVVTVDGADSTWTIGGGLCVGHEGNGTLEISRGAGVSNDSGYIGRHSHSTGTVTVAGTDSTWTNAGSLYVGPSGSGTLWIIDNATVSVGGSVYVGSGGDATGWIHFGPDGGTLTAQMLYASPSQLTGAGTIEIRGLLSDTALVFDSTYGPNQTFALRDQPDQDITIKLDMSGGSGSIGNLGAGLRGSGSLSIREGVIVDSESGYLGYYDDSRGDATVSGLGSTWNHGGALYVGYFGSGTLDIAAGAVVNDSAGYIGYSSGSSGVVTVDGGDSSWTSSEGLYVGYRGSGTLRISGSAEVSNSYGAIADWSGSTGVVTVDGTDSTWTSSGSLYIGTDFGSGTLGISGGGAVGASWASVHGGSLLTIDVGRGSLLSIDGGTGTLDNDGIVRLRAAVGAAAGDYWPIAAATWTGVGSYQALGGTWDPVSHTFTVSGVQSGASGTTETIDLAQTQRLAISDEETGWSVEASFLATEEGNELGVTATAIDDATLGDLAFLLDDGESVLSGWAFTVDGDGYGDGDPVYLSFDVGAGLCVQDLNLWHYDGSQWTEYAAADLSYDGQHVSFAVTGFSGYAVSVVPEPGMLTLLIAAASGLAIYARRRWGWSRSA